MRPEVIVGVLSLLVLCAVGFLVWLLWIRRPTQTEEMLWDLKYIIDHTRTETELVEAIHQHYAKWSDMLGDDRGVRP